MRPPRLAELFAGTRSIGRVAGERGWDTWSTDLEPFPGIDLVADVLELTPADFPWAPDALWASPPCTYFTVAAIGRNWTPPPENAARNDNARQAVEIVAHVLELIDHFAGVAEREGRPFVWYMENPCGKLRVLPVVARVPRRAEVTYCAYGDTRRKPTDIFTNDLAWLPRPKCSPGSPCHVAAPRGSKTPGSTQGLTGSVERSRVPDELCAEVLEAAEAAIAGNGGAPAQR